MKLSVDQTKRCLTYSGVYLGGIGAGGFELRPDGRFYDCRIFNEWRTSPPLDAHFLYEYKNKYYILQLDPIVKSSISCNGVQKINYEGNIAKVNLSFDGLPINIEFSSFFIPGDIKNSSLPVILCKVKGKGKLIFVMPSHFPSILKVEKQRVILKSKEGELCIYTKTGKILTSLLDKERLYRRIFPKKVAAILFDGVFNEEFIISWYFPNMRDFEDNFIGHYYANFFKSSQEVLNYVLKNKNFLQRKTEEFRKKINNLNYPQYLKDAISSQLSVFVKESWLTKDGKFGVWEGSCCCCGLQTTDVAYYGSWLYFTLFPELERAGIKLTAKFQNKKDGWIPHFFPGTFKYVDEYRRKDMNMQFVLMVYRDYLFWKDVNFLKEMYPVVKKAIIGVYAWDTDNDRIPDIEGPDQTFDQWNWRGCTIYLATLWLAALKVGSAIGKIMKDDDFVKRCESDIPIVKDNIIKKLWNGKYFILWNNGKDKDEGCLIDGLTGDWFCYLIGLGHILPEDMIKSHLKMCLKYNKKKVDISYMKAYAIPEEKGVCYINGGYKDNRKYCLQQYEPWTGLEYTFAIHLYIMGMKKEAMQVVRDVHIRKLNCGMAWNHIECGGHYYRAMVIGIFFYLKRGEI